MAYENTAKLKGEVDSLRSKVEQDANEIESRIFTFEGLYQGAFDTVTGKLRTPEGRELVNNLYSDVRQNPLALVLVASGVALLFRKREPFPLQDEQYGSVDEFGDKTEDLVERAKDTVSYLKDRVRQKNFYYRGKDYYFRSKGFFSDNPMAIVGIGMALGALIAAVIPETEVANVDQLESKG